MSRKSLSFHRTFYHATTGPARRCDEGGPDEKDGDCGRIQMGCAQADWKGDVQNNPLLSKFLNREFSAWSGPKNI
jgi:hypothetical protein